MARNNNFETLRDALSDQDASSGNCSGNWQETDDLRPIEEIPHPYQQVFSEYPGFNEIQSKVLDGVFYTDNSLVVSAPTGAGKTVIFELAIVRLLIASEKVADSLFKIIYISPMKALCEERLVDWHRKFNSFGLNCISVTGDSENIEFSDLFSHNLIITTPEKWDCLTRKWKDNKKLVHLIKLFMIDEVHLLNEEGRGSTLETVVCRMKTIEESAKEDLNYKIRFVAGSATIPNIEDIAEWLGSDARYYKFSEEIRPVKLNKIVLGYPAKPNQTPFKFDLSLNYKLKGLMMQYSHGKPTLIFCSTRKIVEMTAKHLVQNLTINLTEEQKKRLVEVADTLTDVKVKETLVYGIGYHHAGMLPYTKKAIENLFRDNELPILVTTSTLAMGVNLPAHLVIIKSTKCYTYGGFQDYTATALLQMIGRAGRPQFDTTATALIMTTEKDKKKFEKMLCGLEPIESNLHRHLTEHLNAEVVLQTITDLEVAMCWLSSTFLHIRARKNPRHYGLTMEPSSELIDKKLLEICQIELNKLIKAEMLIVDQNLCLRSTPLGSLMAKYYLAFETMKLFTQLNGGEILQQILSLISKCHEFSEMYLRVNDKKCLNLLNKCQNKETIRFPLNGKIKTLDMKINCIIQAVLGCLDIFDHSILTEAIQIMRNGGRIVNCLIEHLEAMDKCYRALLSTITLAKCFRARLWENSPYVSKQLPGIGTVMSSQLVNAGKTSFELLSQSDPREIELLINKRPPAGSNFLDQIRHLPKYNLKFKNFGKNSVTLVLSLENSLDLQEKSTVNGNSLMHLLVGDSCNNVLFYRKYSHNYMIVQPEVVTLIDIKEKNVEFIEAHFISEDWVGIDCSIKHEFQPKDNNGIKPEHGLISTNSSNSKKSNNSKKKKVDRVVNKIEKQTKENEIISANKVNKSKADGNASYMQTFMDYYLKSKKNVPPNNNINIPPNNNINIPPNNDINIPPNNNINIPPNDINKTSKVPEKTETPKIIIHSDITIFNEENNEEENSVLNDLMDMAESITEEENMSPTEITDKVDQSYVKNSDLKFNYNPCEDRVSNAELTHDTESGFQKHKYQLTKKKLSHKRSSQISETSSLSEKKSIIPDKKPKITWRSPLTYSPPVKHSPKINYSHLSLKEPEMPQETHELRGYSPVSEETCSTPTAPRIFQSQQLIKLKSSNPKSFFPLSDTDYTNSDEGYESNNKTLDDISDFAALSSFGIRPEPKQRRINPVAQIQAVKSPSGSTSDYYSQLLIQNDDDSTERYKKIENQEYGRCDNRRQDLGQSCSRTSLQNVTNLSNNEIRSDYVNKSQRSFSQEKQFQKSNDVQDRSFRRPMDLEVSQAKTVLDQFQTPKEVQNESVENYQKFKRSEVPPPIPNLLSTRERHDYYSDRSPVERHQSINQLPGFDHINPSSSLPKTAFDLTSTNESLPARYDYLYPHNMTRNLTPTQMSYQNPTAPLPNPFYNSEEAIKKELIRRNSSEMSSQRSFCSPFSQKVLHKSEDEIKLIRRNSSSQRTDGVYSPFFQRAPFGNRMIENCDSAPVGRDNYHWEYNPTIPTTHINRNDLSQQAQQCFCSNLNCSQKNMFEFQKPLIERIEGVYQGSQYFDNNRRSTVTSAGLEDYDPFDYRNELLGHSLIGNCNDSILNEHNYYRQENVFEEGLTNDKMLNEHNYYKRKDFFNNNLCNDRYANYASQMHYLYNQNPAHQGQLNCYSQPEERNDFPVPPSPNSKKFLMNKFLNTVHPEMCTEQYY